MQKENTEAQRNPPLTTPTNAREDFPGRGLLCYKNFLPGRERGEANFTIF